MDLEATLNRFYVAGLISEYRVCAREGGDFGGLDYIRVTTVSDNRRGRLPHWGVSGA